MSSTLFIPFTTNSNYTKSDNTKIEADGNATLILQDDTEQEFSQPFTADTGFTYDSDYSEFTGGLVRTKNTIPANVVGYATYTTDEDLNYASAGSTTGTLAVNASVAGGELDLTNEDLSRCAYDGTAVALTPTVGTIRMQIRAAYSGSPSAVTGYYLEGDDVVGTKANRIYAYHNTGGLLVIELMNSGGGSPVTAYTSWSPTAGQTYDLEFSFNTVAGLHNVFVDGTKGTTNTTAFTRTSSNIDNFQVGSELYISNTEVLNFARYDSVQHTTNFTPSDWSEFKECQYITDKIDLPVFTYAGASTLQSFDGFTVTEVGSPKYLLDGNYWDGAAWSVSDGSYSQANTAAEINTNIVSYTVSNTIIPSIVTESGSTLMSVDQLTIEYTGYAYPTDSPYIEFNSATNMSALESIVEGSVEPGSDLVKHVVMVDGAAKYWNGAAWATSSGYSQSNTITEINTNAATLLSGRSSVKIRTYLYSDDGSTTPTLDYLTLTYNASLPNPTNLPTLVDINGFIYDMNGPISGELIKARPYLKGTQNPNDGVGGGVFQKYEYEIIATTDSNGFFSASVYLPPTGSFVEFKIGVGTQSYFAQIPDQDAVDFNTLTLTLVP